MSISIGLAWVVAVLKTANLAVAAAVLAAGLAGVAVLAWTGILQRAGGSWQAHPGVASLALAAAMLAAIAICHDDHFALLIIAGMLTFAMAGVGVDLHTSGAGIPNLGGAVLLAVGGYATGLVVADLGITHVAALPIAIVLGGLAALVLLVLPRGRWLHAALITLALGLTLERLLKAGPLIGLDPTFKLKPLRLLGFDVGFGLEIGSLEVSAYAVHALLALVSLMLLLAAARIARGRATRLAVGGAALALAGAHNALMSGFVGPDTFGVTESLVLAAIAVVGGLGNRGGVVLAALLTGLVLGKLQLLQELRAPLVALVVLVMLWLRPEGLVPLERPAERPSEQA